MTTKETDRHKASGARGRRRNYLINPGFQWKYTLTLTTAVLIASSLMSILLFGLLHEQARLRALNPGPPAGWSNTQVIVFSSLAFSAVTAGALALWSILITHRISGPMFVIGECLSELAQGRFPTWRPLRKRDEFKEVHATFWRAINAMEDRKWAELSTLNEALRIADSAAKGDDESRKKAIGELTTHLGALRANVVEALGGKGVDASSTPELPKETPVAVG